MKPPENIVVLMAAKTSDQLQEMFQRPDDWMPESLKAAEHELLRRGVKPATITASSPAADMDGLFVKAEDLIRPPQAEQPEPASPQKLSALAGLSFFFAISFPLSLVVGSVGGIAFGHLALWRINRNSELCGKTLAMWGMGMGYVSLALFIFIAAQMIHGMKGLH